MKLTRHAQERLKKRGISRRELLIALSRGREVSYRGKLLVMHGTIRVLVCPSTNVVITAWVKRTKTARLGRGRVKKRD